MKRLVRRFSSLPLERQFLIAVHVILLIVVLGMFLTIARSFNTLDKELIENNLQGRMNQFVEIYRARSDNIRMPESSGYIGYMDRHPNSPPVPVELATLPVNRITPIITPKGTFHGLHIVKDNRHFYLLQDAGPLRSIKQFILMTAFEITTIAVVASLVIARWLSKVITQPVTDLADAVRHFNPSETVPVKLGQRFRENDMSAIANAFDSFVERITLFVSREQAFTEDASHELRTPLTVILSSLQLLSEDKSIGVSGQLRLARIQRAAENMQSLIEALLWISREDSPHAMPQVDLADLTRDLSLQLADQIKRKPLELEFQNLATYPRSVPKGMAASVVGNLLVNAVNHTDKGLIEIILRDDRLEIRDSGQGIPVEDIAHIFERRYRGSQSRGQGLGLYIVKRICGHLNWQVSVVSTPGHGTCFTLEFPSSA